MSKIQFFRNGAVAASLEAAKTAMSGATVLDGEMILGRYADGEKVRTLAAIEYVKDGVKSLEFVDNIEAVAGLQSQINAITGGGSGSIASQITTAIEALDAEVTSADGQYVTVKVTEVDGKITAVNVTDAGVKTYADGAVKTLADGAVATNAAAIAKLNGAADAEGSVAKAVADEAKARKDADDALSERIAKFETGDASVATQIAAAVAELDATVGSQTVAEGKHVAVEVVETDGKLTGLTVTESDIASAQALNAEISRADAAEKKALADAKAYTDELANGAVATNAAAIAVLNGAADAEGSVKKAVADAKAVVDAYTVNGKAISSNPVLGAADIQYAEGVTVADGIKANADAITLLNGDVNTAGSVLHTVHNATLDCGTY